MKKRLSVFLILCLVVSVFVSAAAEIPPEGITAEPRTEAAETADALRNDVVPDSGNDTGWKKHEIEEVHLNLYLPDVYTIYTRNMSADDPVLIEEGRTPEKIRELMTGVGTYFEAYNIDGAGVILVNMVDGFTDSYNGFNDDMLFELVTSSESDFEAAGTKVLGSEILRYNNVTFIKMKQLRTAGNGTDYYYMQYHTNIDYKAINIVFSFYETEDFTPQELEYIDTIIKTAEFTNAGSGESPDAEPDSSLSQPDPNTETFSGGPVEVTTDGDFTYIDYADGTSVMQYYSGSAAEVVVPAEHNGHRVTAIAPFAFCNPDKKNSPIQKISVSEGIETIPQYAFFGCWGIKEIVLPDSLKTIGMGAFSECSRLSSISFGSGLESVHRKVFDSIQTDSNVTLQLSLDPSLMNLRDLSYVFDPSAYATVYRKEYQDRTDEDFIMIGTSLVKCNRSDEHLVIPDGIKAVLDIPSTASSVTFGPDVKYVAADMIKNVQKIQGGENISYLDVPRFAGVPPFAKAGDFVIVGHVLVRYNGKSPDAVVPEGITMIANQAFADNKYVETVVLPESLKHIGFWPFANCSNLKEVNIPAGVETIDGNPFIYCVASGRLRVRSDSERFRFVGNGTLLYDLSDSRLISCLDYGAEEVQIPDGTMEIGEDAFRGLKNLRSVTFPEGLRVIGYSAFCNSGLKTLVLPDSLYVLGQYSFKECEKLTSVDLGRGVTGLESYSPFFHCDSLHEVIARSNIKELWWGSLGGQKNKQTIYGIPGSMAEDYAVHEHMKFVALEDETPGTSGSVSASQDPSAEAVERKWIKSHFVNGTMYICNRGYWPGIRETYGGQETAYVKLYEYYGGFFFQIFDKDHEPIINPRSGDISLDCTLVLYPGRGIQQQRAMTATYVGGRQRINLDYFETGYIQNALGTRGHAEISVTLPDGSRYRFTVPDSDYQEAFDLACSSWGIPTDNDVLYTGLGDSDVNPDLVNYFNRFYPMLRSAFEKAWNSDARYKEEELRKYIRQDAELSRMCHLFEIMNKYMPVRQADYDHYQLYWDAINDMMLSMNINDMLQYGSDTVDSAKKWRGFMRLIFGDTAGDDYDLTISIMDGMFEMLGYN